MNSREIVAAVVEERLRVVWADDARTLMTGPELARLEVTLSFMMGRVDSLLRLALWREARVYVGYIQRCGLRLNSPSQGKNR